MNVHRGIPPLSVQLAVSLELLGTTRQLYSSTGRSNRRTSTVEHPLAASSKGCSGHEGYSQKRSIDNALCASQR